MTGKKLELPVKKILTGTPVAEVVSKDALVDPVSIEAFAEYAASRTGA
jgi:acetoacetyl-CoA synthetase